MFIVIKRKFIIVMCAAVMLMGAAAFGIFGSIAVFQSNKGYTVILDAGHGSPDGGAVGVNGTEEKDINLAIVLKTKEVLEAKGTNVILTRMGDQSLYTASDKTIREKKRSDMRTRKSIIEKSNADLFISVHMNSFSDKKASGLHVFFAKNHPETEPLANELQKRISEITGAQTHSVKTASESLFLMKNPPMGAILVECGFISNPEEEKKLCDAEYQSKIAWAIAEAVTEYKSE